MKYKKIITLEEMCSSIPSAKMADKLVLEDNEAQPVPISPRSQVNEMVLTVNENSLTVGGTWRFDWTSLSKFWGSFAPKMLKCILGVIVTITVITVVLSGDIEKVTKLINLIKATAAP